MTRSDLDPTILQRVLSALRPDWARTIMFRRVVAAALVLLAALLAFRPDSNKANTAVVVAAHDLSPGMILAAEDVALERRSVTVIPDGARTTIDAVVGSTLAGPMRRGEMLTDMRVLGPRLAERIAGTDARVVPVPLADSATIDMVRSGDIVDILTVAGDAAGNSTSSTAPEPTVLATDAVVVLVSPKPTTKGVGGERVVLVALPIQQANRVAAVALVQAITLTFR